MFKCFFCDWQAQNETSLFCPECGPSKNWTIEEVDQPKELQIYKKTLRSLFFQAKDSEIESISLGLRERLKISQELHQLFLSVLNKEKENLNSLTQFRLEFDKNVIDAYAGHDTYLRFRFTNLSDKDFYSITLHWDDPETSNELDLLIKCYLPIRPGTVQNLGGSHIFPRMGTKEISDLRLKVINQFQESVIFRVDSFTFAVGSPEKHITNLTHNQISIEGRGVVDASGMGANTSNETAKEQWIELGFNYLVSDELPENLFTDLDLKISLLVTKREEKEELARQEATRLVREQQEKEERARQEADRLVLEQEEKEEQARLKTARLAREQQEKEERALLEIARLAREQDETGNESFTTILESDEEDKKALQDEVRRFLEEEQAQQELIRLVDKDDHKVELAREDAFEKNENDFQKSAILKKEYNVVWGAGFIMILFLIIVLLASGKSNNQIPSQTSSIITGGVANGTIYNFSISKHCKYNGILLQLGATNDQNILDKNAIIKCDSYIKIKWLAHSDVNQACQKRRVEIVGVEFPAPSISCNFGSRLPNHYLCEIHTSNYPTYDSVSSRIKACEIQAGI